MANTLDTTGRLSDDAIKVVQSVLFDGYPPTNPAVLLSAMREWYLVHGSGPVLQAFIEWLTQIASVVPGNFAYYRDAQLQFEEKTGIPPRSTTPVDFLTV